MIELNDQNFEKETKSQAFVLVDFYAAWCAPCFHLAPILERLAKEYEGKIIFTKANLDVIPITAQKLGIDRIPTVVLFKEGKPLSGFIGLQPEEAIKKWLEDNLVLPAERREKEPDIESVVMHYRQYAKEHGFRLNPQETIVRRIATGLLENEKKYGQRYCPCRRITGNAEEDEKNVCPCAYHLEELEKEGHCFCQLFVK